MYKWTSALGGYMMGSVTDFVFYAEMAYDACGFRPVLTLNGTPVDYRFNMYNRVEF